MNNPARFDKYILALDFSANPCRPMVQKTNYVTDVYEVELGIAAHAAAVGIAPRPGPQFELLTPYVYSPGMKLPREIRERFVRYGREGGKARAARMSAEARQATARRAASSRWIRERFGHSSFAALGLPGGDIVDTGLTHLADGTVSRESLVVSLAAPRLRREGVPIGSVQADPEDRLYELLSRATGDLAHARYAAYLQQISSFADACHFVRRQRTSDA